MTDDDDLTWPPTDLSRITHAWCYWDYRETRWRRFYRRLLRRPVRGQWFELDLSENPAGARPGFIVAIGDDGVWSLEVDES